MNEDIFAEWMRRHGHRVYRTKSSYWYSAGPGVLQAFPYHWQITPSEQELNNLMLSKGIISLRYSTPLDAPQGMISYHVILCPPYSIENLRSQARNGIKRGLDYSVVERIPLERLATEGWKLQHDTLERQCRLDSMTQQDWHRMCMSAKDLPGFEAWAAIVDGELAASILTTRIGDTCYVPFAQSQTKYMNKHVNNALFYTACRDMLCREGVSQIFFTLHSLDAPSSVDEFKFRMSFQPVPVRQRVVFNPLLGPMINPVTHSMLLRLHKQKPNVNIISKAEGLVRFTLTGKKPLVDQPWPECLESMKEDLLPLQESPVSRAEPQAQPVRMNVNVSSQKG